MQRFIQSENKIIQISEIGVAEQTNRGFLLVTFTRGGTQTIYPPLADEVWRELSQAANPPAIPPATPIGDPYINIPLRATFAPLDDGQSTPQTE